MYSRFCTTYTVLHYLIVVIFAQSTHKRKKTWTSNNKWMTHQFCMKHHMRLTLLVNDLVGAAPNFFSHLCCTVELSFPATTTLLGSQRSCYSTIRRGCKQRGGRQDNNLREEMNGNVIPASNTSLAGIAPASCLCMISSSV
jgi:hypothetical protein